MIIDPNARRDDAATGCPACGDAGGRAIFSAESVPIFCNTPAPSRHAARSAARAPIRLVRCPRCGLIHNELFDPAAVAYGVGYENALHHSGVFRAYADDLARELIDRHGLAGGTAIEIGCGQGEFLALLHDHGMQRGIGFDPGFDAARAALPGAVTVTTESFAGPALDRPADLVCCRHVLEHIDRPLEMLSEIRRRLDGRDTVVFFEVPCATWTIRQLGIWDIIYEHCCYYTPRALESLFTRAGFETLAVGERYGGQFLTIEARAAGAGAPDAAPGAGDEEGIDAFADTYHRRVEAWRRTLGRVAQLGERAVVWGAGSKGVTFLNVLRPSERVLPAVVDVNPQKHGRYVAGTGHPIIGPGDLDRHAPHHVIAMNPLYLDEIRRDLDDRGIRATVLAA